MTRDLQYQKVVDLATEAARLTTRQRVIELMWLPFQLLYAEMTSRGEITPIREYEGKARYWKEVCAARPDAPKFKKIWIAQALYMYDLITKP